MYICRPTLQIVRGVKIYVVLEGGMRTRSMRAKETREEPTQAVRDFEKREEER